MTFLLFGTELILPVSLGVKSNIAWVWALAFLRILSKSMKGEKPQDPYIYRSDGLSLVRIKGPHCKQSVNGKHIFVHCSVTVNLALPVLHSSTRRSSANERIKSMWLEAKYEWCNKMLESIWCSEDGGGLGKEIVTSCALDGRLATISGSPSLLFFLLSHVLSTEFSLCLWNIHRVEEWRRCAGALLWLELCLLPSQPCHTQCLCPGMHIWWPWPRRSFLPILV